MVADMDLNDTAQYRTQDNGNQKRYHLTVVEEQSDHQTTIVSEACQSVKQQCVVRHRPTWLLTVEHLLVVSFRRFAETAAAANAKYTCRRDSNIPCCGGHTSVSWRVRSDAMSDCGVSDVNRSPIIFVAKHHEIRHDTLQFVAGKYW